MGLERLLSGTWSCFSRRIRLSHIQHNVFQNPSTVMSSTVSRGTCVSGGWSWRVLLVPSRRGAAFRQPASRLSSSAQPARDVSLFEHDRTRFFRLLSVFCGGQLFFWTYLGHFAYTGLRDTGSTAGKDKTKDPTTTRGLAGMWSFDMNLGSIAWRCGFTLGCLAIGAGIVGLGMLFCRRSVSKVVLHQGGKMVTVSTQSPLGPGRGWSVTVPLSQVACYAHRHESPSFIPLRVKGHKFYFLLDKDGTVTNARLFDSTVGAYRQF